MKVLRRFTAWVEAGNDIGPKQEYYHSNTWDARCAIMVLTIVFTVALWVGIGVLLVFIIPALAIAWFAWPVVWAVGDVIRRVLHHAFLTH